MNSIRETNGNFDSCNSCKRLVPSRLQELHESKFPFVSRIKFIRSILPNFSAHVSQVTVRRHLSSSCDAQDEHLSPADGRYKRGRAGSVGSTVWLSPVPLRLQLSGKTMLPTTVGCLLLLGAALAAPAPKGLDPLWARQKEPRGILAGPSSKDVDPLWARQKEPRVILAVPASKDVDPLWARQKEPREILAVPASKDVDPLWARQKEPREILAVPASKDVDPIWARQKEPRVILAFPASKDVDPLWARQKEPRGILTGHVPKDVDPLWARQKEPRGIPADIKSLSRAADSDPQPLPALIYVLKQGQYYITSPNYPSQYPINRDIRWTVRGDQNQTITIGCANFDVESHSSCDYDYLRINDEDHCGSGAVADVTSTELRIRFFTDDFIGGRGFYCLITVPDGSGATTTTGSTDTTTTGSSTTTDGTTGDVCCGMANRNTRSRDRIVGGAATAVNELPWQAALVDSGDDEPSCGGTVINTLWVMTAAHCTARRSTSDTQVLLRKHKTEADANQIRRNISQIVDHPSYDYITFSHDFSLLRLSQAIDFTGNEVAPACLPSGGSFDDVDAIVSGWGTTSSRGSSPSVLHSVTVQTMSNAECTSDMGSGTIDFSMICADVDAGGKDSCEGDAGGPLVTEVGGRYTLIGVSSWGYGCADQGSPGVYSRITAVSDWIATTTAGASLC